MPDSEIKTGPQAEARESGPRALAATETSWRPGDEQERNGQLLAALESYRQGLERFPESYGLLKAAGRLAFTLRASGGCGRAALARAWGRQQRSGGAVLPGPGPGRPGPRAAPRARSGRTRRSWRRSARPRAWSWPASTRARGISPKLWPRFGERSARRPTPCAWAASRSRCCGGSGRRPRPASVLPPGSGLDPTSNLLRSEAAKLGREDPELWAHLAGDPERVLDVGRGLHEPRLLGRRRSSCSPAPIPPVPE